MNWSQQWSSVRSVLELTLDNVEIKLKFENDMSRLLITKINLKNHDKIFSNFAKAPISYSKAMVLSPKYNLIFFEYISNNILVLNYFSEQESQIIH